MDLAKLAGTLLNSDSLSGLSSLTGADRSDISNVLSQALPALLDGAKEQANNKDTSEGFASALAQHAKDDTSNTSTFLKNVDLTDGAKILTHLLGANKDATVKEAAKKAGVSQKKTSDILSAIAPLLLSLLGQQADEDEDKESGIGGLVGSLLSNVDVGSLLTGLISTNTRSSTSSGSGKKDDSKKKATGNIIGGILSGLLKKK